MSGLIQRVKVAKERLDAHVRETVSWHFEPETGCPFWLEYAAKLDFDPRKEIHGYDDLKLLGHFEDTCACVAITARSHASNLPNGRMANRIEVRENHDGGHVSRHFPHNLSGRRA